MKRKKRRCVLTTRIWVSIEFWWYVEICLNERFSVFAQIKFYEEFGWYFYGGWDIRVSIHYKYFSSCWDLVVYWNMFECQGKHSLNKFDFILSSGDLLRYVWPWPICLNWSLCFVLVICWSMVRHESEYWLIWLKSYPSLEYSLYKFEFMFSSGDRLRYI